MRSNSKIDNLILEFNDDVWYEFHKGSINDKDDFYDYFHEFCDNAVIYTHDCVEIIGDDLGYCFLDHDIFGRPENVAQAAYNRLYDAMMESNDIVNWCDMEDTLQAISIDKLAAELSEKYHNNEDIISDLEKIINKLEK